VCQTPATSVVWICSIFQGWFKLKTCLIFSLKVSINLVPNLLNFLLGYYTCSYQFFRIASWLGLHRSNLFVHNWLSKTRFINFVMSVKSKSDHVNQDILFEFLPVSNHKFRTSYYRFRITSVYSEYWYTKRFYDI